MIMIIRLKTMEKKKKKTEKDEAFEEGKRYEATQPSHEVCVGGKEVTQRGKMCTIKKRKYINKNKKIKNLNMKGGRANWLAGGGGGRVL